MGGNHSHVSHYPDHVFRRASCQNVQATCGLCGVAVGFNDMAYRCTDAGCAYFLHDACFRYPARIRSHFSGHNLALTALADAGAGGCTVCGRTLNGFSHVYSCSQTRHVVCGAGGFRAHPRCGNLPQQTSAPPSHGHQPGAGAGRICDMCKCNNHSGGGGQARPWSYQCSTCPDRELCLVCVLGSNNDDGAQCSGSNQCACGAGCGGFVLGNCLHGFFRGFTGLSVKSLMGTCKGLVGGFCSY
uniref:DC1 domain-containing protein n=1 Tax=Leersia perrieri TaxID=77586 RepID=A0A0D9XA82_9ORYZ